jgi:hypothetical protein
MEWMTLLLEGGRTRAWARVIVGAVVLTPTPAFPAVDAQPAAQEAPAPTAPASPTPAVPAPPSVGKPTASPSEDYKATKKIPKPLLRGLLGCWQLDGQERWTISRLDASGAQVVTKSIKSAKKRADRIYFPDTANRAAIPATLMYDAGQDNFGFSSAARRPTLVVFKHSGAILEASLFSKRSKKQPYAFTGYSATLDRCKALTRGHAAGPRPGRPAVIPPRLN